MHGPRYISVILCPVYIPSFLFQLRKDMAQNSVIFTYLKFTFECWSVYGRNGCTKLLVVNLDKSLRVSNTPALLTQWLYAQQPLTVLNMFKIIDGKLDETTFKSPLKVYICLEMQLFCSWRIFRVQAYHELSMSSTLKLYPTHFHGHAEQSVVIQRILKIIHT